MKCVMCEKITRSERSKYCSNKCQWDAHYVRNKKRYIDYAKKWGIENPEKKKDSFDKFYMNKRDRFNELMRNNYQRNKHKYNVRATHSKYRDIILEYFDNKCSKCSSNIGLNIHHKKYRTILDFKDLDCLCNQCHKREHMKND